jgi:hypothetical protein
MPPCAHTSTDVFPGVTFLQAAFRASTGSSRSGRQHRAGSRKLLTQRRLRRGGSPAAVRFPAPGSPGPPRFEPSARRACAGSLSCSSSTPEEVYGAVGSAFLHPERGLVPKARALSHYSGDASRKRRLLEPKSPSRQNARQRDRIQGARPWSVGAIAPGNFHCAPTEEGVYWGQLFIGVAVRGEKCAAQRVLSVTASVDC